MNFECADVTDIKDRRSSYSQKFKLPRTAHNARIFNYCDNPQSADLHPFRATYECRLFATIRLALLRE